MLVTAAATLATPEERGKTIGMFIGILAARFIAGILTDFGGWRMAYPTSAVLTAE